MSVHRLIGQIRLTFLFTHTAATIYSYGSLTISDSQAAERQKKFTRAFGGFSF